MGAWRVSDERPSMSKTAVWLRLTLERARFAGRILKGV
jgi:hypothetical protein